MVAKTDRESLETVRRIHNAVLNLWTQGYDRLLSLTASMLELTNDGKRDGEEMSIVLQAIKDGKKFRKGSDAVMPAAVGPQPLIDCDADPYIPEGWTVEKEDQLPGGMRGQFVWDPAQIKLRLSPNQQNGKWIKGNKLRKELENEPALPANVLDFLLKNPRLIPEEWKKDADGNTRYIFFWGTIYRDSDGCQYVRCLYFGGGRWYWDCRWLDDVWGGGGPAALRASS